MDQKPPVYDPRLEDVEARLRRLEARDNAEASMQFHKMNKPRIDWGAVAMISLGVSGVVGFILFWIFQHKGLH